MSRLDVIRTITERWNARDVDAALATMSEEVVLEWSRSEGPLSGAYRGKDAVRDFFAAFFEAFSEYSNEITRTREIGEDAVVTDVVGGGTGAGSGASVTARGAMLWRFRGEWLVEIEMFQSYEDALGPYRKADSGIRDWTRGSTGRPLYSGHG